MPEGTPFVAGHFTWPADEPRLLGTRCDTCHRVTFPPATVCPEPGCGGTGMHPTPLTRRGTLASFTVVRYPPPPPFVPSDPFLPFAIAEVAFVEGVQVIGPVPTEDGLDLAVGEPMETVVEPYYVDAEGRSVVGWKFRRLNRVVAS